MISEKKLSTNNLFSSWLLLKPLRQYLLQFPQSDWPHVTYITLLLGFSYLESREYNLSAIKFDDIEKEFHKASQEKIDLSVIIDPGISIASLYERFSEYLKSSFNKRKRAAIESGNLCFKCKKAIIDTSDKFVFFSKNRYLFFYELLKNYDKQKWPLILRYSFYLGIYYLIKLRIPTQLLSLNILRCSLANYNLLFTAPYNDFKSHKFLMKQRLQKKHILFPLQWISHECITVSAGICPDWWVNTKPTENEISKLKLYGIGNIDMYKDEPLNCEKPYNKVCDENEYSLQNYLTDSSTEEINFKKVYGVEKNNNVEDNYCSFHWLRKNKDSNLLGNIHTMFCNADVFEKSKLNLPEDDIIRMQLNKIM